MNKLFLFRTLITAFIVVLLAWNGVLWLTRQLGRAVLSSKGQYFSYLRRAVFPLPNIQPTPLSLLHTFNPFMAKTILIIEDDKDILDMMIYILQDEGFRVISSMESVSLAYVQENAPSLILLDNRLADGFGGDLCRKLKNDPATTQFPVVIVSAVNQLAHLAEESGADAYLNKPFDLDELVQLVHRFTNSQQ